MSLGANNYEALSYGPNLTPAGETLRALGWVVPDLAMDMYQVPEFARPDGILAPPLGATRSRTRVAQRQLGVQSAWANLLHEARAGRRSHSRIVAGRWRS